MTLTTQHFTHSAIVTAKLRLAACRELRKRDSGSLWWRDGIDVRRGLEGDLRVPSWWIAVRFGLRCGFTGALRVRAAEAGTTFPS
jgi:hypothetical protein